MIRAHLSPHDKNEALLDFDIEDPGLRIKVQDSLKPIMRPNRCRRRAFRWAFHVSLIPVIKGILEEIDYRPRSMSKELKERLSFYLDSESECELSFTPLLTPYPFQKVGINFLIQRQRCILADEQGLGKTLQEICALYEMYLKDPDNFRALGIVPSSVLYKWEREFKKILDLPEGFVSLATSREARGMLGKNHHERRLNFLKYSDAKVLLINYDQIRMDLQYLENDRDVRFSHVFLDEFHRIRNYKTKQSKTCNLLMSRANTVHGLTGTPLQGKLEHIFSVFKSIDDDFFSFITPFRERYLELDYWKNVKGYKNESEIKKRIPFILKRRLKSEVAEDLPEMIFEDRFLTFSVEERQIYNQICDGVLQLEDLKRESQINNSLYSKYGPLIFLEQCCDSLELISTEFESYVSTKMKELIDDVNEIVNEQDEKVVIFTKYLRMANILKAFLEAHGYRVCPVYGGGLDKKRKQEVRDAFIFGDEQIFIMTTAGKEGIDLHGDHDEDNKWVQGASKLIFFDIVWNDGDVKQIKDRVHRLGQTKIVVCTRYFIHSTIEDKMRELYDRRDKMFDDLINHRLTKEEVLDFAS